MRLGGRAADHSRGLWRDLNFVAGGRGLGEATKTRGRIDAEYVAREAVLPDLAARYGIELSKAGREYEGLCPFHAERSPSFKIFRKGDRWRFHCFGCKADGDAIGFVMKAARLSFPAALRRLADDSGLGDGVLQQSDISAASKQKAADRAAEEKRQQERRATAALTIWREGLTAAGSPVETYLRARGIAPERQGGIPPSLRHHPLLRLNDPHRPGIYSMHHGMVAAVQGPDGRLAAIHRTFLKADGSAKATKAEGVARAKMMLGPCWGNAVRFDAAGEILAAGEGIETVLSVRQALRQAGDATPCWAALSLGNLGAVWLPDCVKRLVILADADSSKPELAEELLRQAAQDQRDRRPGLVVTVARPLPGMDFNDMLRSDD